MAITDADPSGRNPPPGQGRRPVRHGAPALRPPPDDARQPVQCGWMRPYLEALGVDSDAYVEEILDALRTLDLLAPPPRGWKTVRDDDQIVDAHPPLRCYRVTFPCPPGVTRRLAAVMAAGLVTEGGFHDEPVVTVADGSVVITGAAVRVLEADVREVLAGLDLQADVVVMRRPYSTNLCNL